MSARPRPHADRRRLSLAMLLSLFTHAVVLTLFVARPASSGSDRPRLDLDETPAPPRRPLVKLGSESSQITTITWIGFDEYKPHVAELSTVDQPELTQETAPPPGAPPTTNPPSPPSALASLRTPVATTTTEPPPPPVITQPLSSFTDPAPPSRQVAEGEPAIAPLIGPLPPPATTAPPIPTTDSAPTAQNPQTPTQPKAQPESTNPPNAVGTEGGGGGSGESEVTSQQSDKESQASSVITAAIRELGQPLTARGLEMKTVRPRFTYYTQLTASPRNPLVRLHFDRGGKVQKVQIMQSSGVPDIDRPILDAMYQWRAAGKQLETLSAGTPPGSPSASDPKTLAVDIRLILSR